MSDPENESGFKITDKRAFTSEGEARTETKEEKSKTAQSPTPKAEAKLPDSAPATDAFQMTFETLVMSLSSTAMVQLGIIADPSTDQPARNLPAAKQTIDILEILQQKTKGNLDSSESKLLENILYELRLIYLEVSQAIKLPR
jgi:hypothetical protein